MSQRNSEYARRERDHYPTPPWVTGLLVPHLRRPLRAIWEPACGQGQMAHALRSAGPTVHESDIVWGVDFLEATGCPGGVRVDAIVTNPPYGMALEFIEHALRLMEPTEGQVAMLLRVDFDSAKTRSHVFRDCPAWSRKLVLTNRIMWFQPTIRSPGKSPSENHAWFLWDWAHEGPPTIGYAP